MAIGGFATAALGTDAVFILNSITYMISAWFIYKAGIPYSRTLDDIQALSSPFEGIKNGFRFLKSRREILRPVLAKAWLEISIGALVYLLILVSDDILMLGSVGLGLLYASRGLGTAVGPIVIRRYFPDETNWIKAIGICMALVGFGYVLVGMTTTLWLMLVLVVLAHAGSGANWVISTILIQKRTPDEFRGRVFSSEWLLFTLIESISVMIAASLLYFNVLSLQQTIILFGSLLMVAAVFWHLIIASAETKWQENKSDSLAEHSVSAVPTSHLGKQKARI
jgi:hypothetical protein